MFLIMVDPKQKLLQYPSRMEVINETLPFIQWNPYSNGNEELETAHKNMGEVHKLNVEQKKKKPHKRAYST